MNHLNLPNFDRVSPIYDFSKTLLFLGAIQRCQYFHLSRLKDCNNILVIGGGTGRIIEVIHRHCKFDSMLYVDSSVQMIKRARSFIRKKHPQLEELIEFQPTDILNLDLGNEFDAIVMPFVTDCFSNTQLAELGEKLNNCLSPRGMLLISDFYESEHSRFANTLSRFITASLYFVLDVLCSLGINRLPDFNCLLRSMTLEKTAEQTFFAGVLRSTVYTRTISPERQ